MQVLEVQKDTTDIKPEITHDYQQKINDYNNIVTNNNDKIDNILYQYNNIVKNSNNISKDNNKTINKTLDLYNNNVKKIINNILDNYKKLLKDYEEIVKENNVANKAIDQFCLYNNDNWRSITRQKGNFDLILVRDGYSIIRDKKIKIQKYNVQIGNIGQQKLIKPEDKLFNDESKNKLQDKLNKAKQEAEDANKKATELEEKLNKKYNAVKKVRNECFSLFRKAKPAISISKNSSSFQPKAKKYSKKRNTILPPIKNKNKVQKHYDEYDIPHLGCIFKNSGSPFKIG